MGCSVSTFDLVSCGAMMVRKNGEVTVCSAGMCVGAG